MIGRTRRPNVTRLSFAFWLLFASFSFADCIALEEEAKSGSDGVYARLNTDGGVEAVIALGEGSFLAPKRSLIKKAKITAELSAKRVFSNWLRESVAGGTTSASLMESVEETNVKGETTGLSTEITQIGEFMASSTSSVLSGLVKLDECVDVEQKYVLVELGWKPELSAAAESVVKDISGNSKSRLQENAGDQLEGGSTKINPAKGYRKKSTLKDDF